MAFSPLPSKSSPFIPPKSHLLLSPPSFALFHNSPIQQTQQTHSKNSSIPLMIKSCSSKTHLLQIHAHLLRTSLFQDPSLSYAFLSRASLHGNIDYSRLVLEQIENPNVFHYNAMLKSYSQSSMSSERVVFLYRDMYRCGVLPNAFSCSFILKACTKFSSISCGKQVHARILRDGHQSDSFLLTSLMGLYAVCGDSGDATRVFAEMPERGETFAYSWSRQDAYTPPIRKGHIALEGRR